MQKLEESFTLEEIKQAVFDSNGNKAPGPDGLPFSFYQTHWELVQHDISLLVNLFYNHTLNLSKINHAFIVLIPKGSECTKIEHFRPISFKLLANRISIVIDTLIDNSQTTFIKGRNIHDNITCAQEILFKVRKIKSQGILVKIDFKKAFNLVNWYFLLETLPARF
jgi:Reverse transcriptase (RNA-dependent DNA polymerase)